MINGSDSLALPTGLSRTPAESLIAGSGSGEESRKRVAQEFAALLLFEVIKTMRASVPKGGLFEQDSLSNDVYTTLADMEVARAMTKKEAMGLEKLVEKALESYDGNSTGNSKGTSHPAVGVVSSPFGLRADPFTGEKRLHKGIDLAMPKGSPISAVAAGKVVYSGHANGYGNTVVLDHGNGIITRYAHNQVNLVSVGDAVEAGQEIALVGSTGRSTGPHLHFEVLQNGTAVDPSPFLTRAVSTPGNSDGRIQKMQG